MKHGGRRRGGAKRTAAAVRLGLGVLTLGAGVACGSPTDDRFYGTTERRGRPPTTLYLNNGEEPEYIDPTLTSESSGAFVVAQIFEGLVQQHPETLAPVPGVASRYDQSDDNRVFRFHLRRDAGWSDGVPVRASDFVYAWRRALEPATGARMAELMYNLKNGRAYHQRQVARTTGAVALETRPAGDDGQGAGPRLPAGSAVRVWLRLPADTRARPRSAVPEDRSTTAAAMMASVDASPAPVTVVALGPEGRCDGAADRWYRVRVEGRGDGFLLGCVLASRAIAEQAVVTPFDDRPRFGGAVPASDGREDGGGAAARATAGFVPAAVLAPDPDLVGVRAVDDHTLEVELEKPTPYFLELLAYATFFPVRRDVIERFAATATPEAWTRPEHIVSNGPYRLAAHAFRYEMTLEKNPHHPRRDDLRIDRVVVLQVPSYHATMNLYKTGEIDYLGQNLALPQEFLPTLRRYEDFQQSMWNATYWYEFNTEQAPVDDVRVRRALNLAVDKEALVTRVAKGGQVPATHYVPDFVGGGYRAQADAERSAGRDRFAGDGHEFDPERARALLGEAGYPVQERDGSRQAVGFPDLEILYNTSEGHRSLAVALQAMWKRHLGVSVTLRNEEWKVMIKNLRDGRFQIARFGWVGDYNHPHSWLETFAGYSNNNWTRWSDPRFDRLLAEAASTGDPVVSMERYRDAESLLVDALPRLPLYFYTKSTLIKPYVRGFFANAANRHNVAWMWIDPDFDPTAAGGGAPNRPAFEPGVFPRPGPL
ncbi:MAG: peptide ABC transporter substrate-binding protein [Myxococcota bacterium]